MLGSHRLRLPVLALAAALAAACGGAPTPEEIPGRGWNLVVVTLDTLRADHLGCYGYADETSPHLDRLATRSLLFERAIAQSAVTPVSHASIFTGLDPYRHGLRSLHGGAGYALPAERVTLAELLRDEGYATGGFVSAFPATRYYGLDQGFETWDEDFESHDGEGLLSERGIVNTGRAQRRGDETTERALAWLRTAARGERPFFAWVHYFDVHDPLLRPPEEHLEAYLGRFPPASASREDRLRALYDAEIAFVDLQVGRLLDALDELGVAEETVVAVLADPGEGLGDHDWWGHGILYQEQIRVPFLLHVPGIAARREGELVRTVDLVPTLLEILGVEPPAVDLDGESLFGERGDSGRLAYSESLNDLAAYYASPLAEASLFALQDERFKLLVTRRPEGESLELFDLAADPGELTDVAAEESRATRRLARALAALGALDVEASGAPLDPEAKKRLEALGYIR